MEMYEKFLNALVMVAQFAEPNMVITKTYYKVINDEHGTRIKYKVKGYDEITEEKVEVVSRGYIDGAHGAQIEVIKGDNKRMFPYFGFNWTYLRV